MTCSGVVNSANSVNIGTSSKGQGAGPMHVSEVGSHQSRDVPSDSITHSSREALDAAVQEPVYSVFLVVDDEVGVTQATLGVPGEEGFVCCSVGAVRLIEHLSMHTPLAISRI